MQIGLIKERLSFWAASVLPFLSFTQQITDESNRYPESFLPLEGCLRGREIESVAYDIYGVPLLYNGLRAWQANRI